MDNKFFPCSIGVRCDGKGKYAVASINSKGQKRVRGDRAHNKGLFCGVPIVRGLLFFVFGLISFFSSFDDLFFDDVTLNEREEKSKRNKIIVSSIFVGIVIVFWLVLLGYVPAKLSFLIIGHSPSVWLRNLVIACAKVLLMFLLLLILRFVPAMIELYKFNGACNVIQNSKAGDNTKKGSVHYGLNLLNFVVFSFLFSSFVITLIGVQVHIFANWLINLAIFAICTSLSYEILALLDRFEKTKKLCVVTSFLVVSKPNTTHIELARTAYLELNSHKEMREKMKEEGVALSLIKSEMETKLRKAGKVDDSDIEWIIATVLDKNRTEIKLVRSVSEKEYREIMKATEERAKGKPLSSIFGFVDFYGFKFSVNKKVLSPRMETEILVEKVLEKAKLFKKPKILDIGTGSGAIATTISLLSNAEVTAVDISKGALDTAKENAKSLGAKVNFVQSDLFAGLKKKQKYDIIVSNPPYIRTLDIEGLDREVKDYDPRLALDGGEDGLDFYRKICETAPLHINKNGYIFFEIGKGQYLQVKKILEKNGWTMVKGIKDYNKIYRVVKAEWKK